MVMIDEARKLKVEKISNTMYEVNGNFVRFIKKMGRTLFTCSCYNGTRFCNEPTICKHKIAVIGEIWAKEK